MSKTIKIPNTHKPNFVVEIGNKKYSYPANTTQSVPDEVAKLIENNSELTPKEDPKKEVRSEEWKFTMANNSVVTKKVMVEV